MTSVSTFTATIYIGRKVRDTGEIIDKSRAANICQTCCDSVGFCVTMTETEFIYTDGREPGFAIGIINYPRFPDIAASLRSKALELAKQLKEEMCQWRVSVVMPDETVMLGEPNH